MLSQIEFIIEKTTRTALTHPSGALPFPRSPFFSKFALTNKRRFVFDEKRMVICTSVIKQNQGFAKRLTKEAWNSCVVDNRPQCPIECRNKACHAPQRIITTLSNYHVLALRSIYSSTYRFDGPLYFFKCAGRG